jgi:hypothetical protein
VELLLSAAWDRGVTQPEPSVWAPVAASPVAATLTMQVPRRGARVARTAALTIRGGPLTLCPPRHRQRERLSAVPLWAVQAWEAGPGAGPEPLEGLLWTTCAGHTPAEAIARVDWYTCRWGVAVWQRILQSGWRIDARPLETAARLQRCLPLYSGIAWRIFSATMLGRVVPDAPCTVLLALEEWPALSCALPHTPIPPPAPPSRRQAVRWLAQLGGFVGRRGDGEPGAMVLWRGLHHLTALTTMYCIMRPLPAKQKNVGKT